MRRDDAIDGRRPSGRTPGHAPAQARDQALALVPASAAARRWLFVLVVVLPLALVAVVLVAAAATGDWPRSERGPAASVAMLALLGVVIAGAWAALAALLRRHRLEINEDGIDVRTGFQRRRLPWSRLLLAQARVIDLDEHTAFKPLLRLAGTALPGFRSGWFLLRDRRRAFVAMTDGPRVLWIPTGERQGLLLQPGRPQALLDALRAMAPDASQAR